ncbi:Tn3 family transposase, partial [Novosphingobium clariflavum]
RSPIRRRSPSQVGTNCTPIHTYWNTVYLDRAAQHLNAVGTTFDAALLAHLSPMGWAHISLTGDYLWEQARRLPAGEFHPLNEPMARLKRVA